MLAVVTAIGMVYRILTILLPSFRAYIFKRRARGVNTANLSQVLSLCDVGDWFLLSQLSKNLNPRVFDKILSSFLTKLEDNNEMETLEHQYDSKLV